MRTNPPMNGSRRRPIRPVARALAPFLVAFAAATTLGPALQLQAQDSDGNVFHRGDALPWGEPDNGMRVLSLYGDPYHEGEPFAFRIEVQAGFEMGPHTHPITEHMTVLSGRFFVGIGETMDREAATGYGPGSYIAIGAGVPAFMWAEEETVVQVHGVGPLITEFIQPPPSR